MKKEKSNGQTTFEELDNRVAPVTTAYMESVAEAKKNGEYLPSTEKKSDSLPDIHFNPEEAKQRDGLNTILSKNPPASWVKTHPITNGSYIQISTVEMLMRKIFQRFRTEVMDIKVIANAVAVHVRLHYIDPVSGEWDFQDGLGAVAIQVDKGAAATDFTKTKSDAIMKNLPAAESYAVKDAAEKLGNIFGANLNRKDEINFTPSYKKETQWTTPPQQ